MENREKGTFFQLPALILSLVIFGTIGLFRRWIPLPSGMLAFSRGLMGGLFLLIFQKLRGRRFDRQAVRAQLVPLVVSGALIGVNWILLFEAYSYTTVAIATLCYYCQPVIVTLAAPVVVREPITLRKGLCVLAALAGMLLVSGVLQGDGSAGDPRGVLLGLGAAVLYASVVLLNKKITGVPVFEKTIVQLFSAASVMVPYLLVSGTARQYPMSGGQILAWLAVGLVHTGIAYALYFGAVERLPAQTSALLSYIDPVTAVLLSALLLREPMTPAAAAGALLILGAAAVGETGGRKAGKEA